MWQTVINLRFTACVLWKLNLWVCLGLRLDLPAPLDPGLPKLLLDMVQGWSPGLQLPSLTHCGGPQSPLPPRTCPGCQGNGPLLSGAIPNPAQWFILVSLLLLFAFPLWMSNGGGSGGGRAPQPRSSDLWGRQLIYERMTFIFLDAESRPVETIPPFPCGSVWVFTHW